MVIAFIPVRGGSKSIPLKNIKPFCGMPLVYWTAKAASDSLGIDKVIVATDSDKISEKVKGLNIPKLSIYKRSDENARDESSTESVLLEYFFSDATISEEDDIVLIQATSPLLIANDLKNGLEIYGEGKSYDSVLSCVRFKRFFWNSDGSPINYEYEKRPRRQEFDGTLMENGAFYINKVKNIVRDKNRLSGKVGICEMPEYTFGELDEEHDWLQMEGLMRKHILKSQNIKEIKLLISDVDGVLTDAGMYYSENGDELKKFNTRDGMGFELARKAGLKTAIITSENTKIVERRAAKMKVDFLTQGAKHGGKLNAASAICEELGFTLDQVAYIGDDINCYELLSEVGIAACPQDASETIKSIPNIYVLDKKGGSGVVREFIDKVLIR
ncbi:acylneuraminate cytidylyltransferase [Flagellimonas pelagia]|uniref:N-acylneuraminate cytidylyltransferase n=1 Tax=Flagellimonas pelagia TaxID=2306998 RepID=A0A3A1NH73_9FLAO|nr:acylneuraminate cytidylyltransferase [Allomuricauda maritima]RIV44614.1 acylneuraminate cytidylyltransferase [Allomuricauda maritima]TXJ94676.1 acylneuraminate cytidylyltransferase [Allomuricauda maritima]